MGVKPSKLTVAGAAQGLHLFPVSPSSWTHDSGTPNVKPITFSGGIVAWGGGMI